MLTEKDYCDYDTCVALKELGYVPTHTTSWSIEGKLIVHLYDTQKWLREEKRIEVIVLSRGMIGKPYCYQIYEEDSVTADDRNYDIYEEALSEGIKESIKILKEKKLCGQLVQTQ